MSKQKGKKADKSIGKKQRKAVAKAICLPATSLAVTGNLGNLKEGI